MFPNYEDDVNPKNSLFDYDSNTIILKNVNIYDLVKKTFELVKMLNPIPSSSFLSENFSSSFAKIILSEKIKDINLKSNDKFLQVIMMNIVKMLMNFSENKIILEVDRVFPDKISINIFTKTEESISFKKKEEKEKIKLNESHPNFLISKFIADRLNHVLVHEYIEGNDSFKIFLNLECLECLFGRFETFSTY